MKNKSNTNKYRKLMLVLLVLMVSAIVVLPSGCLDSEEEQSPVNPNNGSSDENNLVDENPDSMVEFSENDTSSEQNDDTEDTTPTRSFSSGSQAVDPSFTSGGNSDSSSNTPEVVEDVTIEIPSGSYTVTETHVGNLTITGNTPGTITLPDTLTIDGNLNVNTPYATVNNYAIVGGTITIFQVADDTWNQYANAGKLVMHEGMGIKNADFKSRDISLEQTLNLMSGNIPGGIYLEENSILRINGGSTPNVNLLGRATVIVNNTASNLPKINVTPNAEDSNIDNLADEPLNLELHSNVSASGNVNPDNDSFVREVTSRGLLTVSPTACPIGNESVILTYTMGQDIVNGTIIVYYNNLNITGATYSIADEDAVALGSNSPVTFNEVNISKGQKIVLSFVEQEIDYNFGGYYYFRATSNNSSVRSEYASTTLKVLNNNTALRNLVVDNTNQNADENNNYSIDVTYDTEVINVSADLDDLAASMTINGNNVRDGDKKEITLNEPGTSTEVPIIVTAEDGITTGTYTLTINRAQTPVATPTASPVAGLYFENQSIELSTTTEGASIYYTTDETDPTNESTLYADAIDISANTTIKAISMKDGMANSSIATFAYIIGDSAEVVPIVEPTFDKNPAEQEEIGFEITSNDAGNISEVRNGDTILVNTTDYDIIPNPFEPGKVLLGINSSYLAGMETGTTNLTIDFEYGEDAVVSIEIIESISATINPTSVTFDKKISAQENLTTIVTLNSASTVTNVTNADSAIGSENYTFDGTNLTILKDYLALQTIGDNILSIEFDTGESANLTVNITDTSIEITGYEALDNIDAGTVASPIYASTADVTDYLNTTYPSVNISDTSDSVPISSWTWTDTYDPSIAASYTFTGTIGTIPGDYVDRVDTIENVTVEVIVNTYEITDYDELDAVNGGTVASPNYADVAAVTDYLNTSYTTANITGTDQKVSISEWNDTDNYDASVAGSYTFTAENITLPESYVDDVDTIVNVTVEVIVNTYEITGYDALADVDGGYSNSATYGDAATIIDYLNNSYTTAGITDTSATASISEWVDTDNYDPATAGSYTFTAENITLPESYVDDIDPIANVSVEVTITAPTEITGFADIAKIDAGYVDELTYANATEVQAILPANVTANTGSGDVTVNVSSWTDTDTYANAEGNYNFTAVLDTLPEGYANTDGHTATVEVVVAAARSTDANLTAVLEQAINAGDEAGTSGEPKNASISVPYDTTFVADPAIVTDDPAAIIDFYGTDSTFETIESGNVELTAGGDTIVYIKITAEDETTVLHYAVTISRAAPNTDASLATVLEQAINAGDEAGTSGEPKNASISVANDITSVADPAIVTNDPDAIIDFYGTDSTFETIESGNVELTAGGDTVVYIKIIAEDETTILHYAVTISRAA